MERRALQSAFVILAMTAAIVAGGAGPAAAQFNAGSSGKHGVFPPIPSGSQSVPGDLYIVWNVLTGTVRYCSGYDLNARLDECAGGAQGQVAQISGFGQGELLTSGIYEFQDFSVNNSANCGRYIVPVNYSPNVPLTILSQGDIKLLSGCGTTVLYLRGANGNTPQGNTPSFSVAGGKGGPGGFDGGSSGNGGATPSNGNTGFGPSGGAGGSAHTNDPISQNWGIGASASPLNPSLTPISGGSGGGGAAGVPPNAYPSPAPSPCNPNSVGYGGGSGGGGGGALVLAANNSVQLAGSTSVELRGGDGSHNANSNCALWAGGGGGGSLRIVSQTVLGNAQIWIGGGYRIDGNPLTRAAGGFLRVEAAFNTSNFGVDGASGGSFISFPTAPVPTNTPTLTITSLNGIGAPSAGSRANLAAPDITFGQPLQTAVPVSVVAHNVPPSTSVVIKAVPAVGSPTTATPTTLSGDLATSTATANIVLPPGAGIVTASATFTPAQIASLFPNGFPLIDGEQPEKVEVLAAADGSSHVYLIGRSGARFEFSQAIR